MTTPTSTSPIGSSSSTTAKSAQTGAATFGPATRFCRIDRRTLPRTATGPGLDGWGGPPDRLALLADEIHLWRTTLDDPDLEPEELEETLSVDELARSRRMHFSTDRQRFIAARGWLRSVLAGYLGMDPARLAFGYGPHGKPELTGLPPKAAALSFNLAHTGSLAVLAVTRGRQVGVDVEKIRPVPEAAAIAERFFTPRERTHYFALPPARRDAAFFNIWTRKEAMLKGRGSGLDETLDQLEVLPEAADAAGQACFPDGASGAGSWRVLSFTPVPAYAAAFALGEGLTV